MNVIRTFIVDIDECRFSPCEHGCINTPGSFECVCNDGHELNSNGRTCTGMCVSNCCCGQK